MKTMLITFAFGAVMGAGLAYTNTADHYEDKARALREATAKAEQVRADKAQGEVDELFEKYKDALIVEPVTVERVVTKRLYIKSDCAMQADQTGQMDNGSAKGIVRLGAEADRSVKQVIKQTEADYTVVKNQLLACVAATKD